MQEEDMGMVSCCCQPSKEEGRLERDREINNLITNSFNFFVTYPNRRYSIF